MDDLLKRWPKAFDQRSLPVQAHTGATTDATQALIEKMYLDELDRQAAVFNRCFLDAMTAALVVGDDEDCWRHLQGALFAAIIVNRLIDPQQVRTAGWPSREEAQKQADRRAARLRQQVLLPGPAEIDSPLYAVRKVRDAMEHIDERLDRVARSGAELSTSDWYVSDGTLMVLQGADHRKTPTGGMRAFVATAGMLFFNDEALNMFELDLQMLALRNNIREALPDLESRMQGPFTFGGTQLAEFSDASSRLKALGIWEVERREREASLTLPVEGRSQEAKTGPTSLESPAWRHEQGP